MPCTLARPDGFVENARAGAVAFGKIGHAARNSTTVRFDKGRACRRRPNPRCVVAWKIKPRVPTAQAIEAALLRLIGEREGKTVDPQEAARELGGSHPDQWGPLMQPIRRVAVALAEQGRVVILRKGKPVDPRDFKGVYRLTAPRQMRA